MEKIIKPMNVVLPGIRLPVRHDTLVMIAVTCWMTVLVLTSASQAADIYVTPGCTTGNEDGTATYPYHTLTSAHAAAAPNDSIIMKRGFYPETLTLDKKLTITAYGGSALVGVNRYNVGWRDVDIDLSTGNSTKARVYYPSCANGEDTQIASPLRQGEKFPAIVFAHGNRFESWPICEGWSVPEPRELDYLRAEGLLTRLASSGIITVSFDWISWTAGAGNIAPYVIDVIDYLNYEFVDSVDPQNMGLMGHSTGGEAVILAAHTLKTMSSPPAIINGLGLIAPGYPWPSSSLSSAENVLVIHGTREHPCQVGFQPLEIYCELPPPKHLVYVTGANHFGYVDGICLDPDTGRVDLPCWDPYEIVVEDYLPYGLGFDNSSLVGGETGQLAHDLQQLAAGNYLEAFFRHYLLGNTEALDYLIQSGESQQCGFQDTGECENDFVTNGPPVIPPSGSEPVRYFDDLEFLNVEVNVSSCLE